MFLSLKTTKTKPLEYQQREVSFSFSGLRLKLLICRVEDLVFLGCVYM